LRNTKSYKQSHFPQEQKDLVVEIALEHTSKKIIKKPSLFLKEIFDKKINT